MSSQPTTSTGTATLNYEGGSLALPTLVGTEHEPGINIEQLRGKTGFITVDPGFGNTGSCKSAITFIDGDKGILRYRGYDIAELAQKSSFLEVAWLLMHGELPSKAELDGFTAQISEAGALPESLKSFFASFPKDGHPMPIASAAVSALATFDPYADNMAGHQAAAIKLIGKFPALAAWQYRTARGEALRDSKAGLDYASNFLQLMFGKGNEAYAADPAIARALDLLLILHADHEQNCSTSTVRVVGSSHANAYASVAAGIQALWGPLHGGANQQVIEMLEAIEAEGGNAEHFMQRAKDKNDNTRLMGFGHRVYKNYDPRAAILKKACEDVLEKMGVQSKLLDIAMKLEEIALNDDYFKARKLYPNVDFYSGIIYQALGIPVNMFTVMFALGRMPGWIAQYLEMRADKDTRIARPRQIYTGATLRPYKTVAER